MAKKVKKIIFPGATLLISLYLSISFAIGMVIGYLGTNIFDKKLIKTGRVKSLVLPVGEWKVHFHHWLLGGLAIILTYLFSSLSIFWIGFFGGLIFHDVYTDKGWYKVIYKRDLGV